MARKSLRELDVSVASQRRRQIIDAARACLLEEGADKLTLRGVARRAGVNHATISYHFRTKKQMLDAALLDAADEYIRGVRERRTKKHTLTEFADEFLESCSHQSSFV